MILTHTQQGRRAAFTLVELLVVIGLMAVLATISVAGYSAATRGMADRGTIQTTVSILRVAQQTCQIDRVPTKVMFFNQRLFDDNDPDTPPLFQGTAIAIKQAGRITLPVMNKLLIDEFADWNQSYPQSGSASAPDMRIFQMKSGGGGGLNGCSTLVRPYVSSYELSDDFMIQAGATFKEWCSKHGHEDNDKVWGFMMEGGKQEWSVGDAYGVEIARIDLPRGHIFGSSTPNGEGYKDASDAEVHFEPSGASAAGGVSVSISGVRPAKNGKFRVDSVGKVTESMLDDK